MLARLAGRNEPCAQSWNTTYISTESPRYGTTDVARSSRLRPTRGRTYGARASRQQGRSLEGLALRASPIAVVVLRSERAISPPLGPTTARRYTWRRLPRTETTIPAWSNTGQSCCLAPADSPEPTARPTQSVARRLARARSPRAVQAERLPRHRSRPGKLLHSSGRLKAHKRSEKPGQLPPDHLRPAPKEISAPPTGDRIRRGGRPRKAA